MFTFLIVLIALIALFLVLVVLVQSGKGGGLAGIAAGGTTQILGARQAPDILEKATWTLATLFIVLCILTNFAIDTGDATPENVLQGAEAPAQVDPLTLPGTGSEGAAPAGEVPAGDAEAPAPAGEAEPPASDN